MKKTILINLVQLGAVVGAVFSAILIYHHINPTASIPLCGTDSDSGCNLLNRSTVSEFLGMPIAFYGFLLYSAIFFLFWLYQSLQNIAIIRIVFWLSLPALVVDLGLLVYSVAIAKTLCTLCAITYGASALILVSSALYIRAEDRQTRFYSFNFKRDFLELFQQKVSVLFATVWAVLLMPLLGLFIMTGSGTGLGKDPYDMLKKSGDSFVQQQQKQSAVALENTEWTVKGADKGLVEIVIFADYLCPHCADANSALNSMLTKLNRYIKISSRFYPLDATCNPYMRKDVLSGSCHLAAAAYCAAKQDKFAALSDHIYENQQLLYNEPPGQVALVQMATQKGLNGAQFAQCLGAQDTQKRIADDIALADKLKINATPTIFIDGKRQDFLPPQVFIEALLLKKMEEHKASP